MHLLALALFFVFFFSVQFSGQYGQLGIGDSAKQTSPAPVETLEREVVRHIACGHFFTVSHCQLEGIFLLLLANFCEVLSDLNQAVPNHLADESQTR